MVIRGNIFGTRCVEGVWQFFQIWSSVFLKKCSETIIQAGFIYIHTNRAEIN